MRPVCTVLCDMSSVAGAGHSSFSPRPRPHGVSRAVIPRVVTHSPSFFSWRLFNGANWIVRWFFSTTDTESFCEWMSGGKTVVVLQGAPSMSQRHLANGINVSAVQWTGSVTVLIPLLFHHFSPDMFFLDCAKGA